MTGAWLLPIVSAGLFGSLHCVGMCGPLVAVAADGSTTWRQRTTVQLVYQAGRLGSYALLGALAGALGQAVDLAGGAAGVGHAAGVLAGLVMVTWGLMAMLHAVGVGRRSLGLRLLSGSATRWLGNLQRRPPTLRALLLGGASALLPCGFLYAFALAATSTGSALGGALVLGALWLGNLPALLGFGVALGATLAGVRRHLPLLSAAAIFALGIVTITSRVNVPAFAVSKAVGTATAAEPHRAPATASMPEGCPFHPHRGP